MSADPKATKPTTTAPPAYGEATTTAPPTTADEAARYARVAELDRLIAQQEQRLAAAPPTAPDNIRDEGFTVSATPTVEYVAHLAREQEAALRQLNRDFANIEAHQLAMWRGMPPEFEPPKAHFFRCGLRGPSKEGQRTEQLHRQMRRAGWVDAPKGTYSMLWQTDGNAGCYVMMMDSAWKLHKELQRQANAAAQARNEGRSSKAAQDVMAVKGLHVERFDVETRRGSVDDFDADTRGMRR
jgi:hypothetical protein